LRSTARLAKWIGCHGTAAAGTVFSSIGSGGVDRTQLNGGISIRATTIIIVIEHSKPSHCIQIGATSAVDDCSDRKEEERTTPTKYARIDCNGHLGFSSGGGGGGGRCWW